MLEAAAFLQFLVSKHIDCFHAALVSPCKFVLILLPIVGHVGSQLLNSATMQRMDCVDICRHNHSTAPEIYIFKEIPFRHTFYLISWMLNLLKDYFALDT